MNMDPKHCPTPTVCCRLEDDRPGAEARGHCAQLPGGDLTGSHGLPHLAEGQVHIPHSCELSLNFHSCSVRDGLTIFLIPLCCVFVIVNHSKCQCLCFYLFLYLTNTYYTPVLLPCWLHPCFTCAILFSHPAVYTPVSVGPSCSPTLLTTPLFQLGDPVLPPCWPVWWIRIRIKNGWIRNPDPYQMIRIRIQRKPLKT